VNGYDGNEAHLPYKMERLHYIQNPGLGLATIGTLFCVNVLVLLFWAIRFACRSKELTTSHFRLPSIDDIQRSKSTTKLHGKLQYTT